MQYRKQGPTQHRPMADPVVLRYLSYSTMLAKHAVHRPWQCPAFGRAGTCLFLSVQLDNQWVSHLLTGWGDDHGPTNVGDMVKTKLLHFEQEHLTIKVSVLDLIFVQPLNFLLLMCYKVLISIWKLCHLASYCMSEAVYQILQLVLVGFLLIAVQWILPGFCYCCIHVIQSQADSDASLY